MSFRVACTAVALALGAGCSTLEQHPDRATDFTAWRAESYALTLDPAGEPVGIWDLAYPRSSRAEWSLERDMRAERPIRLVNFVDAAEYDELLGLERRAFGVNSWFWYWPTLGVGKWSRTGELFDRRELRQAHRALLRERLRIGATPLADRLGATRRSRAVELLGQHGSAADAGAVLRNRGGLLAAVRADLVELGVGVHPTGPLRASAFGELGRFVCASIGVAPELYLLYDLGRPGGARLLLVLPAGGDPSRVNKRASLALNQAVLLTGAGINAWIVSLTGVFVPWIAIAANTWTSIRPSIPLDREDGLASPRATLLVLARAPGKRLPAELRGREAEIALRLEHQFLKQTRGWPRSAQRYAIMRANWSWLESGTP